MNIFCRESWLFVLFLCSSVESLFTIIGPKTVQYKSVYKCILSTTYTTKDAATVTVKLAGKTTSTDIEKLTFKLNHRNKNKAIEFDLGYHNPVENFTLSAVLKSTKSEYSQSVDVFVIPKRYSVFIQTDKPVYKPGDEILYRILILDSDLKPFDVGEDKLKHNIYDGLGNMLPAAKKEVTGADAELAPEAQGPTINENEFDGEEINPANPKNDEFPDDQAPKQKKSDLIDKRNGKITKGVYSYSYQLNDEPLEGTWSINVIINNEHQFATIQPFQVKRYILPRFEVFIDTKHNVNRDEGDILLNIYAKYTFGKYVTGKAKIKGTVYDMQHPDIIQKQAEKVVSVDMKATLAFNMRTELEIANSIRPYEVRFDVEFEEALTGQIGTTNATVRVYKYKDYIVNIVREKRKFKPGSPYKFEVEVMQVDGQPAEPSSEALKLYALYHYKPLLCTPMLQTNNLMHSLDYMEQKTLVNGKARFVLNVPENTTALSISAKYFESSATVNVSRHNAGSREYLTIEHVKISKGGFILPQKVGNDFKIKVRFTNGANNNQIYYVVVSRHGIVEEVKFQPDINDDMTTISITATELMTPTCNVIVYYFHPAGEIVYDQVKVDIPMNSFSTMGMLFKDENKVKMPGQSCKLLTKATPGSFVSLLGVDQSVKLLGHGNDIDIPRVSADMKLYDSATYVHSDGNDGESKYSDFIQSNSFIITDAFGHEKNCSFLERLENDVYNIDDSPPADFGVDEFEKIPDGSELRKVFPETWIFKDFKIGDNGKFMLDAVVPDTITSFIVSGFAVHPDHGLSIAVPRKITVFKEFFAKLYVPYSIRLGEVLKVDVSVFNYLSAGSRDIEAAVVLEAQDEFEFVDVDMKTCTFTASGSSNDQMRTVSVPYNNGAATYFLIRARKVGLMKLSVHASTSASKTKISDSLEKIVKVEREGYRVTENKALNIDMRNVSTFSHFFQISFPPNYIGDSIQISSSVIGDLLGPALINIHSLMRMPAGCTEQIFKSFIPNVVAMKYLKAIGKLTSSYKTSGESYLKHGYQELLKRRLSDGSFSLWGEKDAASVWLTAYVAKVLGHTKEYVAVDDKHILGALEFVKKHQNAETGGFSDASVHNYFYISKTASQRGLALTTFIAIAFMENVDHVKEFKSTIDKTMTYISVHVAKLKDSLSMAMAAYAFALHGNPDTVKEIFGDLEKISTRGDNTMFWEEINPSVQVETAAYTVMAMVKVNKAYRVLPIVNWLVTQRQASGGFYSTTDTVIGVQALSMYAIAVHSSQKNLYVKLSYENQRKAEFNISEANALVLQSKGLKPDARRFELSASGNGFAIFQVTYSCNVNVEDPKRSFEIKAESIYTGKDNLLHLKICASFIPVGNQTQTGMTLVEVYLPSGYEYDAETEALVKKVGVKRVETAHQKTVIILYFNTMTSTSVCPEIKATRKNIVENLRSYPVKVYDYYSKNLRASSFYSVKGNKKCGF